MTYYRNLLFLLILLLSASCKQEEAQPGGATPSPWADASSARASVAQLYHLGLPQLYFDTDAEAGVTLAWSAYLSGLVESEASKGYYPALAAQRLTSPELQPLASKLCTTCAAAIQLADSVLQLLPQVSGLAADEEAQLLGEAHFFRAFNRFYLLRTFGVLPKTSEEQAPSLEESYRQLEHDLQRAIALLPSREKTFSPYRVSGEVARALLAEVYLQWSGYPLRQERHKEAVAILRPIVSAGRYRLTVHGDSEEQSAFNQLRTQPHGGEYLLTLRGERTTPLAAYAFPRDAKNWQQLSAPVAFNAFKPSKLLMSAYEENDLRGKDRQYFHTFYKVASGEKTVFEVFDPAPWFWMQSPSERLRTQDEEQGLYPYAEVLLLLAEALLADDKEVPTAIRYLAEVRARALQVAPALIQQALAPLSREELLQELWLERLRELPFQLKQLADMQRTRRYPQRQGTLIRFLPLEQARTPQGNRLSSNALYLPTPTR